MKIYLSLLFVLMAYAASLPAFQADDSTVSMVGLDKVDADPMQVVRQVTGERVGFDIYISKRDNSLETYEEGFSFVGARPFRFHFDTSLPDGGVTLTVLDDPTFDGEVYRALMDRTKKTLPPEIEVAPAPRQSGSHGLSWKILIVPVAILLLMIWIAIRTMRPAKKKHPLLA